MKTKYFSNLFLCCSFLLFNTDFKYIIFDDYYDYIIANIQHMDIFKQNDFIKIKMCEIACIQNSLIFCLAERFSFFFYLDFQTTEKDRSTKKN